MAPETVIFDMDDVLCHYDLGRRLRALSRLTGQTPRDIRAAIWDSGFEDAADTGGYAEPDDYLSEFGKRLGYPITRGEWIATRREAMQPWPDMLAIAAKIGAQARVAIYSNNGPMTKAGISELYPELCRVFAEQYYSFEFGIKKPDPKSFGKLMERMGTRPETCWFIDDKKSNVAGARLAGLAGHHFRSSEHFIPDAAALGFTL